MYKVLLVDDEPAIREGLRTIVNWPDHGFQVAGVAGNGREAVDLHASLSPDLIVIDIRMPVLDGITAIGEIRRSGSRCRFLILSGYADFTYARQAITQGVDGYILKPLDEEELETALIRIRSMLDRESQLNKHAVQGTVFRRDEWIGRLLFSPEEEAAAVAENELLPLLGPAGHVFQIVLLELAPEDPAGAGRQTAVRKRWTELVEERGHGFMFSAEPYLGLLLKEDVLQPACRREMNALLLEGAGEETRYTAAAGEPVRRLAELRRSYEGARRLMKRRFLMPGRDIAIVPPVICTASFADSGQAESPVQLEQTDVEALAQQLFYAVDIGSKEAVENALSAAGEQITGYDCAEEAVKKSFAHLMTIVLNRISAAHRPEIVQDVMSLIPEIYRQTHYDALYALILDRLQELIFRLNNGGNTTVMKQVLDFIQRHYTENLKLELLASLFKYNSGYLGKMFKQHTGESFNTYLDKVRIRHAIGLLGEGLKVHQVSDRVGYANVDYFHSKFKKYVGMAPSSLKGSPEKALAVLEAHKK